MAMYTYSLSADFSNEPCLKTLTDEILSAAIAPDLSHISVATSGSDDDVYMVFVSVLSGPEQTALDAVVAVHDGTDCPSTVEDSDFAYITLARLTSQSLSADNVYEDIIYKDTGPFMPTPKNITTLPSSAGVEINVDFSGIYRFSFLITWNYGNLPSTTIQYFGRASVNGLPIDNTEVIGWTRFSNTNVTIGFPPTLVRFVEGDVITVQGKTDNSDANITFASLVFERVDN